MVEPEFGLHALQKLLSAPLRKKQNRPLLTTRGVHENVTNNVEMAGLQPPVHQEKEITIHFQLHLF